MHIASCSRISLLHGRAKELEELDRLLDLARKGRGGSLVLLGETGIGKTALLKQLLERSAGFRTLEASGVEFEAEFAFAALHQLCAPMLERMDNLQQPQREALSVAFGQTCGTVPDQFRLGLGVLNLLAETAAEQPLLCVIDDAQWLDQASAQALGFVARRIEAEPIVLVIAHRDEAGDAFTGLATLRVEGLADAPARELLASEFRAPLDAGVRERILAEAHGNPLALLELPKSMGPAQLAGGFGLPDTMPVPSRIENSYRERLQSLPVRTEELLVVVAAEPTGDPALLWRAAEVLDIEATAAAPAEAAGLIELGTRIHFRHPLVRSAAYRAASIEDRRRAHHALAEATDPAHDPDRRAWHRAQATPGPDEDIGDALVRSADRAHARGGIAAEAAFLERSAALTAHPGRRAARTLAAARAKLEVGAVDNAVSLLSTVENSPLSVRQRAQVDLLRGQMAFSLERGSEAPLLLLRAAERVAQLDPALAREYYLDAVEAGMLVGRVGDGMMTTLRAALAAPPAPVPPRAVDLVLDAVLDLFTGDYQRGVSKLEPIIDDADADVWVRRPWLGSLLAMELWNLDAYMRIAARQVETARAAGSLLALPIGLATLAGASVRAGDVPGALSALGEMEALVEVTGVTRLTYACAQLTALRAEPGAAERIRAMAHGANQRGDGLQVAFCMWATALLHNGRAEYAAALAAARTASAYGDPAVTGLALAELVEAAVRCGERDAAVAAHQALRTRTSTVRTEWGEGVEQCAAALIAEDDRADAHYHEAIKRLGDSRDRTWHARAQLLYGEWLRRHGRRREARTHLRSAHELFDSMRAEAFADRAAAELRATGEKARRRTPDKLEQLTPRELTIARLVATGATSKEIGTRLFLSPRTIDAHLRSIFKKLGVTSRRQLKDLYQPENASSPLLDAAAPPRGAPSPAR
ncbi:AAA family ATPase [Streptomyces sp. 7N604]|uniref:AAA family ATPase n=1 Tax=Streptomyces sp. 7N604 TaxID=3457415 RepID=UPI003FD48B2F